MSEYLEFLTKAEIVLAARCRRLSIVTSPIDILISVSYYCSSEEIRLYITISELLAFQTKPEVGLVTRWRRWSTVMSSIDSPISVCYCCRMYSFALFLTVSTLLMFFLWNAHFGWNFHFGRVFRNFEPLYGQIP